MQKQEIIDKLDKLKESEMLRFTMLDGCFRDVARKYIVNYLKEEFIEAPENNFKSCYCSIASIDPVP